MGRQAVVARTGLDEGRSKQAGPEYTDIKHFLNERLSRIELNCTEFACVDLSVV
jgi:hypothetical protein